MPRIRRSRWIGGSGEEVAAAGFDDRLDGRFPVAVSAQCASPIAGVTGGISTINLIPLGSEPFAMTLSAESIWQFGCNGSGFYYPNLSSGDYRSDASTMNVYVFYETGRSTSPDGRCGYTNVQVSQSTGQIVGASVFMLQQDAGGADCGSQMRELVAHEIGHVLGLGDAYAYASCNGTIMGNSPSYVSTSQCQAVDSNFFTPEEYAQQQEQNNQYCTMNCWTACVDGLCDTSGGTCGSCSSPILLDLDGNGFHLTGLSDAVLFDLNATGTPVRVTWTRAGERDAFLCLDRNHNGRIDSGEELFGDHTLLANGSRAPNGYEVLKEWIALRPEETRMASWTLPTKSGRNFACGSTAITTGFQNLRNY